MEPACPNPISRAAATPSPLAPHPGFLGWSSCAFEEDEEEGPHDAKTGLGLPSSAHLRRRCLALPLWWPPTHSRHPLLPQDGLWSACFSSAINSPRDSSFHPPPPSPRCLWLVDGHRHAGPPRSSVRHLSVQGAPRAGSSSFGLPGRSPENPSPQAGGPPRPLDLLPVFSFVRLVLEISVVGDRTANARGNRCST
jgi:hypothetical protein